MILMLSLVRANMFDASSLFLPDNTISGVVVIVVIAGTKVPLMLLVLACFIAGG